MRGWPDYRPIGGDEVRRGNYTMNTLTHRRGDSHTTAMNADSLGMDEMHSSDLLLLLVNLPPDLWFWGHALR